MRNDSLASSEPGPRMPPAPEQPWRPWRPWLISAAAAASVLLVIGLVVAGRTANPAGTSLLARTTSVPPFYTQFGAGNPASPRTPLPLTSGTYVCFREI